MQFITTTIIKALFFIICTSIYVNILQKIIRSKCLIRQLEKKNGRLIFSTMIICIKKLLMSRCFIAKMWLLADTYKSSRYFTYIADLSLANEHKKSCIKHKKLSNLAILLFHRARYTSFFFILQALACK